MRSDLYGKFGIDPDALPSHVAIIMDGNGRWAQKRLMSRVRGHEKGSETVRSIVTVCREIEIGILTLYAFSTENWARPESEIKALMNLLKRFVRAEQETLKEKNIRLNVIGQMERLPEDVQEELNRVIEETRKNSKMTLNLALSYGSKEEITRAVRKIAADVENKRIRATAVCENLISRYLYTAGMADPDLLIRTSGEMRLSNFLLWQIAYTEMFITDTLWPDFTKEEFLRIIGKFQKRNRRFGKV